MKYVCKQTGTYQLLDINNHRPQAIYFVKYNVYEVRELDIPMNVYNDEFKYVIDPNVNSHTDKIDCYISEADLSMHFRPAVKTHYQVTDFGNLEELNEFLKEQGIDNIKDVDLSDLRVMYIVEGDC